jgi:hypothetical protein
MTPRNAGHGFRIETQMENTSNETQHGIEITDWHGLGAGMYRFRGSYMRGGFWADARLEYRSGWRASVESTNYEGDADRLADLIGAFAERM